MSLTPLSANLAAFVSQLQTVDDVALVILKGQLLLEEALERIIGKYVHHADRLEDAKLTFWHRVALARSMSLDEADNSMWELILGVNSVRNHLAHSLDNDKRTSKLDKLRALYVHEAKGGPLEPESATIPDVLLATNTVGLCLGFLSTFEQEIIRFRSAIDGLDRLHNPHRYT